MATISAATFSWFLVLLSGSLVVADDVVKGLCQVGLKDSYPLGSYKPQCREDGNFRALQCNFSSSYCWCVVPETGERLKSVEPFRYALNMVVNCTEAAETESLSTFAAVNGPCHEQQLSTNNHRRGQCRVKCTPDGKFDVTQCCPTGYCTCVEADTGRNTTAPFRPWISHIDCTKLPLASSPPQKLSLCQTERAQANKLPLLVGQFVPACTDDGLYFQPMQCSGSSGFCWCVNKESGKRIHCTKLPLASSPPQKLSLCQIERAQANKPPVHVGRFLPTCTDDGLYFTPMQCSGSSGFCWCVNKESGKRIGDMFRAWEKKDMCKESALH